MGQDLTGKTISSTYEDLVQISGSILTDGTGSEITNLTVTASFATTATSASFAENATSSSFALTASFAENVVPINTGSFMITGSVSGQTLTFEKGDGSTFNLTVAATGSAAESLVTASISDATITFTKGDASTFDITVNNVQNASTASIATSASFATFASSSEHADFADFAFAATSASHAANADNAISSSYAVTASFAENATDVNALYTASVVDATISFLKGGGGTFPITVNNVANAVSASYATTASFALTASALVGGVSLQSVLDTGNTATQNILLTGNIELTGSYYQQLQDNEDWTSEYIPTANNTTPNFIFAKQSAFGTTGVNNILIGSSNTPTGTSVNRFQDVTGTNYSNTIIGGNNNVISGSAGSRYLNTIIGGNGHVIGKSDLAASINQNAIVGGGFHDIFSGFSNALLGGSGHNIYTGSLDTTPGYNGFLGGQNHDLNGGDYNAFVGGFNGQIDDAKQSVIVGGENNTITQTGTYLDFDSVIVGGRNNNITHARSVILGGDTLSTSKDNEVVVPILRVATELTASGLNYPTADGSNGHVLTTDGTGNLTFQPSAGGAVFPYTGSAGISGSLELVGNAIISGSLVISASADDTSSNVVGNWADTYASSPAVHQIVTLTQAEYNALTPNANTLYVISGSTFTAANLDGNNAFTGNNVFSGSVRGEVEALSISSNTASMDLSGGNFFTLQLVGGSDTHINPTNIQPGQTINLRVNTTGSATVSFPSSVKQVSGSAYVPTTTDGVDIVTFISFDTGSIYLSNVKNLV